MSLSSLFNFPVQTEVTTPVTIPPGGLQATGAKDGVRKTAATGSAFITPQVIAAYPMASGIVAAFWKAAERLFHLTDDSLWVCFAIAILIAFFNYYISVTDAKLQATSREKMIGAGFALLNGFYLFTTAIGISVAIKK